MEKIDFQFRRFDFSEFSELIEIYILCFGKKPDEHYFKWKYKDNPAGNCEAFVAIHQNTIAAFHGTIPEEYLVNGKKHIIYQTMDIMTHPNYRRMGLFTKCGRALYNYVIERDSEAYFIGFPGLDSHPGFVQKLGFTTAQKVQYYFINKFLFSLRNIFRKKSKIVISSFTNFDKRFDQYFIEREIADKPIQKYIDSKFLNWQYFEGPLSRFKAIKFERGNNIIGFALYKLEESNRCFLHFLDAKRQSDLEELIGCFCQYVFNLPDVDFIYTFRSTNKILMKGMKKYGFIYNPLNKGPFSYKPPIILYSNKDEIENVPFLDINNFEVQPVLRDY